MTVDSYFKVNKLGEVMLVTDYLDIVGSEYDDFLLERMDLKQRFEPSEFSDEKLYSLRKEYEAQIIWNETAQKNLPIIYDEMTKRGL